MDRIAVAAVLLVSAFGLATFQLNALSAMQPLPAETAVAMSPCADSQASEAEQTKPAVRTGGSED